MPILNRLVVDCIVLKAGENDNIRGFRRRLQRSFRDIGGSGINSIQNAASLVSVHIKRIVMETIVKWPEKKDRKYWIQRSATSVSAIIYTNHSIAHYCLHSNLLWNLHPVASSSSAQTSPPPPRLLRHRAFLFLNGHQHS